jgi:RNA polymerase sigma-70 factor (ECF subfamily)
MSDSPDSRTGTTTREFFAYRARDGWARFADKYGGKIYDWCRARGLQDADAEDVCSEFYCKLLEKWESDRKLWDPAKGSLRAWLRTVTRNIWSDIRSKYPPASSPEGTEAEPEDSADPVEEIMDAELREEAQRRTQLRVTPRQWEVYRLRMYEGRSAAEVAEQMHVTVGVVNNYTSQVRAVHKEELARLFGSGDEPEKGP